MRAIQNIIVPIDFSDNTKQLAVCAIDVSRCLGATVHLVIVVSFYAEEAMFGMHFFCDYRDALDTQAHEYMANLVENCITLYSEVKGKVGFGEPVEMILKVAEKKKADLTLFAPMDQKGSRKSCSAVLQTGFSRGRTA